MASADGRTCSTIAFRFIDLARSRIAIASACCCADGRPVLLGQSILATVDTQAARNSRGAGGGFSATTSGAGRAATSGTTGAVVVQLLTSATAPAIVASANMRRFMLIL